MKISFLILLVLSAKIAVCQLDDNFSDSDLSNNPSWTGSNGTADFSVVSNQLRSNSTIAKSNFYVSTPNDLAINCSWEFWCNLQFNPSSANYVDIYLTSNQSDLQTAAINGFFIRIGDTNDDICLYKRTGAQSTAVKLIDGTDGILNKSNNKMKIRVTRTASYTFILERDLTGTGDSYIQEGSITDSSFTTSAFFGILIQQSTSSFFQKHFFDDFKISPESTDQTAPKLVSATALDSNRIEILFNEPLDSLSAKLNTNYLLDNGYGNPARVITTQNPARFIISYPAGLKTADYELTALNVKDRNNNRIDRDNKVRFSYIKPYIAAKNDIVINEIFADPAPQIDLPSVEFIELRNTSKNTISLKGWTYSDLSSKAVLPDYSIKSGDFLILCARSDTDEFKQFGPTLGISPWPSLNNASDIIKLKSPEGNTIDSVAYNDSWYKDAVKKQGGWSLERIDNNNNTCNGFYNWNASIAMAGGTPGTINSINMPGYLLTKIKIDSITVTSDSTLRLSLNIIPDTSFIKTSFFTVDNAVGKASIARLNPSFNKIDLKFDKKFTEGISYRLMIDSIRACSGTIPSIANQIPFSLPLVQETNYPLVINEIFADPSPLIGLPGIEFVELYNTSDQPVPLKGMIYEDPTVKYTFTKGEIEANGYLILCPLQDTLNFKSYGNVLGISPWPSLNNDKDVLILRSNKGKEFHRVTYNDSWYKDIVKKEGGWSLELIDPRAICSGIQNWTSSIDPSGGTPGRKNSVYMDNTTNEPLKLLNAELLDSITVELRFNRIIDSATSVNSASYSINNGLDNPSSVIINHTDFQSVQLKFSSINAGNTYKITVNGITDCAGSLIAQGNNSAEFFYADRIASQDILINELLFNPRPGGVDFLEIYNNSNKTLDLKDLAIATIKTKDSLESIKQISARQFLFRPGQYVVVTTDPDNIRKEYHTENPDNFIKLGALPPFNDDAGTVVLLSNNSRIDQLDYSEKMHFALIKNAEGISLERSLFNQPANAPGNFRSAAASAGYATPGYKNSQFTEEIPANEEVYLTSQTLSPDNDGFEDVLNINYQFPQPGMIANISIFNAQGALVHHLTKNLTLASRGTLTWDGLTDQSQRASVGIYIVYFEVFDLNGKVKKYHRNCALATKLN